MEGGLGPGLLRSRIELCHGRVLSGPPESATDHVRDRRRSRGAHTGGSPCGSSGHQIDHPGREVFKTAHHTFPPETTDHVHDSNESGRTTLQTPIATYGGRAARNAASSQDREGERGGAEDGPAHQLIDALAIAWQPEDYRDVYQEKVAALIEAKHAGETVEKTEPAPKATGAVDLMEALRASVERARSPKDTGEKAGTSSTKATRKKPATKKRATSASVPSRSRSLRSLAKAEPYEKATEASTAAACPGRAAARAPARLRPRHGRSAPRSRPVRGDPGR
ncbi:hypothetical protein [Streptomyces sp. NPDC041003]|uniref:hypothetical protein n=1 Tax=Streptomyces sp. NPDC041003 TaxID=3155730 RepID=UPI003408FE7C